MFVRSRLLRGTSPRAVSRGVVTIGRKLPFACVIAVAGLSPVAAQSRDPADPPAQSLAPDAKPLLPQINVAAAKPKPKPKPRRAATSRTAPQPAPEVATAPVPFPGPLPVPFTGRPNGMAAPNVLDRPPVGEPVTTVDAERFKDAPVFTIGDMLQDSPGIDIKQGNGPRDVGISIRGSNAQNGFGIRNIVMLEDGFPVTQPDGLSRSDLTDPHAYSGLDVYRGPASAMFGNFATGGAINFRSRTGGEINGFEYGTDVGSFGYLNNYLALGRKSGDAEFSLFSSDVRGQGFIEGSDYSTQTVNFLGTFRPTPDDRITVKFINNYVGTELPLRLSLGQYEQNPYQKGCAVYSVAAAAAGCGTESLFLNGFAGTKVNVTSEQAGNGRHDTRTIGGLRWEHDIDNDTTWRTQIVYDDKDINQPTGTTSAVGNVPAHNITSDITRRGSLLGFDATQFFGLFYNVERLSNYTHNLTPGGSASLGALTSFYDGGHDTDYGARWREEVKFNDHWAGVAAVGVERSAISANVNNYAYSGAGVATVTPFGVDTAYFNYAPEIGLLYKADDAWLFRGRVATGYGTPQISNLTTTPQGLVGNNSQLQPQRNLGFDLGADWSPMKTVKFSVTGFYEFFEDEIVTQSPGAGLSSFSFNAPASEHRGVEIAADWKPLPGWRMTAAYTYDNQIFTNYTEQLSAGVFTSSFNRAGNKIPGVSPNELLTRIGYDQPTGPLKGVGGFVEVQWKDAYFMDNANLIQAPGYEVVNLNLHYNTDLVSDYLKSARVYFEVRNIFNQTYVASANNVSDSLSTVNGTQNPASVLTTTGTGSIYAGEPRAFYGGVKFAFR